VLRRQAVRERVPRERVHTVSEEGMKVTDKRMFTPEGELREEYRFLEEQAKHREPAARPAEEPSPSPAPPPADARPPEPERAAAPSAVDPNAQRPPIEMPDAGPGGPAFFDLLGVLAEPIPFYLGDARLATGETEENLEAARFYIDLLDVLRHKTAGNLTAQEADALEDLLYRLRVRYVQKRG
jgi:hypothetical protein